MLPCAVSDTIENRRWRFTRPRRPLGWLEGPERKISFNLPSIEMFSSSSRLDQERSADQAVTRGVTPAPERGIIGEELSLPSDHDDRGTDPLPTRKTSVAGRRP